MKVKETSVQFGMTAAVVLAAGRSARMGRPKALLPHIASGSTFLSHLVAAAHAAHELPILVVGRADDLDLQAEVVRRGAVFVENREASRGQLSSVLAALDSFGPAVPDAMLLLPVDVPLITPAVLGQLMTAAKSSSASIVRAACHGRHGHPVLFKRTVFDDLRTADPAVGARSVVRADPSRVLDVETGDPGVLVDVDTPEDYLRVFGRPL